VKACGKDVVTERKRSGQKLVRLSLRRDRGAYPDFYPTSEARNSRLRAIQLLPMGDPQLSALGKVRVAQSTPMN
jgi:hypothetical protein